MEHKLRRMLWGVVLGVVVYAVLVFSSDAEATFKAMRAIEAKTWAMVLGLVMVNYLLRFIKWQLYLRALGFEVRPYPSLLISLSGMVMSVTPGKLGEVFKSALLHRYDARIAPAASAPVVLVERLTDLLGLVVIGAAGAGLLPYGYGLLGLTVALVIAALGVVHSPRLVERLLIMGSRGPKLTALMTRLGDAYKSAQRLLGMGLLLGTTALSALSWSMEGVALWIFAQALGGAEGQGLSLLAALAVYAVGTLAGALSFLPGGLVVMEAGLIGGMLAVGMAQDKAQAAALTTLIRLSTLWFGVGLGLVALTCFERWIRARAGRAQADK